jgi:hypothetical protein
MRMWQLLLPMEIRSNNGTCAERSWATAWTGDRPERGLEIGGQLRTSRLYWIQKSEEVMMRREKR